MRYLTKSRFKLALECPTKLFYTKKTSEYANVSNEDSFLQSLAEGGFQVGELAKFYFHNNPIEEKITIETRDEDKAIAETNEMLSREGRVVIAEAAFKYKNLFVRVDILVKEDNKISIYEVKAKSSDFNKAFFESRNLRITSNLLSRTHEIVLVKSFEDKTKGLDYFTVFTGNREMLIDVNSGGYDMFIISSDNYVELFKNKDITGYGDFFETHYLSTKSKQ